MIYLIYIEWQGVYFATMNLGTIDTMSIDSVFANVCRRFPASEGYSLRMNCHSTQEATIRYSEGA